MSELKLAPPPSSSPLRAIGMAVAVLLLVGVALYYFLPQRSAHLAITHVEVYPAHTVFASETISLSKGVQDDLYVVTALRVQNDLKIPIFMKDFKGALTDADGAISEGDAVAKGDLANVYTSFPVVKALASGMALTPLDPETTVAPGASAEGMVLLHFPGTKDTWDKRKSAALSVSFYHQEPATVTIP